MSQRFGLPRWAFTSDPDDPVGESRIKVDVRNTAFYRGREFRSFIEVATTASTPFYARFVCPVDFILTSQELILDSGAMRFEVFIGATPSGVWTTSPYTMGKNRMMSRKLPFYVQQASVELGGAFTGGTLVDLHVLRTSAQSVTTSSAGGQIDHERGLPANTFYFKFSQLEGVNGSSTGIYSNEWEEQA